MREVEIEKFKGPLITLLDLIESRKLSINEISLKEVADQYLDYFRSLASTNPGELADFLVVAATLMLIKSKSLLPSLELTGEEEKSIEELETRLKIYREIRLLSFNIKNEFGKKMIFEHEGLLNNYIGFIAPKGITKETLFYAIKEILGAFPENIKLPEKNIDKIASIEEKIKELMERIRKKLEFSFNEMTSSKEKTDIIVTFLALLELVRQGLILAVQERTFGNISVKMMKKERLEKIIENN